jgi:hypothetical protein
MKGASTAAWSFFARFCNVHGQSAAINFFAIVHINGIICFSLAAHRNECETLRSARGAVFDHIYRHHITNLREQRT